MDKGSNLVTLEAAAAAMAPAGCTGKVIELGGNPMSTFKRWTVVLIALLLLPNVTASADEAKEAYDKGKTGSKKEDFDAAAGKKPTNKLDTYQWGHSGPQSGVARRECSLC